MTLKDKIAELPSDIKPSFGTDLRDMQEDIYYYFTELDQFEVLKVEQTGNADQMIAAACLSTMQDPIFKIMVAHTWQRHLAFDEHWSEFETVEGGIIFRFLTWDDEYVSGEISFERAKLEVQ
ncbi:MAG: hypothetical protein GQ574_10180 [Crocinitomix sp.]|nr:hypothetical protein [Crocinitomix sp.]